MRVDQFVPGFAKHDAIGNHALEVRRAFREAGFDSDIWGEVIDARLTREARPYTQCPPSPDPQRLILYHASTHSPMAGWLRSVAAAGQAVAVDYHNITPSRYFARWEPPAARSMHLAREELASLVGFADLAVADSAYNEEELVEIGFRHTAVCPLVIDLEDYHRPPDAKTVASLRQRAAEGERSWLFVGRIAPNKCQHDVVAAFAVYRKLFDARSRLTLVGGPTSPRYQRAIETMVGDLDLLDCVEIRAGLSLPELVAHYTTAEVFVCLSEHEGFCVPIIEAMALGLPVVAYSAAAVTDTVGDAGVLLSDKDPLAVASAVDDLLGDTARKDALVAAGQARAGKHSLERTSKTMVETVGGWLSGSRA